MTDAKLTKQQLLSNMRQGWNDLISYLMTLTPDEMTEPTDAAGWTVKDHLAHLAVWADGVTALLEHRNRYEAMGLDRATWDSRDFDRMNAVIFNNVRWLSLPEVRFMLEKAHNDLLAHTEALSEEDLYLPNNHFQTDGSASSTPVIRSIVGDSYSHYAEHIRWMQAIVAS